jgi:hypothetical protein
MRRSNPKKKGKMIPITGLSLFVSEAKPSLEADIPGLGKLEVFRILNQQWDELENEKKLEWEKRADYCRRTEARRLSKTDRVDILEDQPSAITGYSIYLRERHNTLKKTNPEMTLSNRAQQIQSEWSSMTAEQKRVFINIAKRETRRVRHIVPDEDQPSNGPESFRDE